MPDTESFVTAILDCLPVREAPTEINPIPKMAAPWPEVAAWRIHVGGRQVQLSIRREHPATPAFLIDFIGFEPAPDVDLVVVYLNAAETRFEPVPDRYILGKDWRSVSHLYFAGEHGFGDGPAPALAAVPEPQPSGGRRLSGDAPSSPRLSIATIVYNGAELIEQTIQSVLIGKDGQTEYIVVDGASTDDTLAVVSRYRDHIDYWHSEPDKGIYDGFNRAISMCQGEFMGAIHANDLYYPGWSKHIQRAIDEYPDDEFFFGKLRFSDANRSWVRGAPINSLFEVVMFGYFNHPTCFIRLSAYERLGGYRQQYSIAGDYDLGIRFWKSGVRFRFIDAVISCFRLGGVSSTLWVNQWQRHQVRIANGENGISSFGILLMVIANYWIKAPLRWLRR